MEDYQKLWSSVGSAGIIDPADIAKVKLHNSIVQLGASIGGVGLPAAGEERGLIDLETTAVIRYGVLPVEGALYSLPPGPEYPLHLRLRWRPGQGRINAKLKEVEVETGTESVMIEEDSSLFASEGVTVEPQEWFVSNSLFLPYIGPIDFVNRAYYVELTLSARIGIEPLAFPPAVAVIQLVNETAWRELGH